MFVAAAAKDIPPELLEQIFGKIKLGSLQTFKSASDVENWVAAQEGKGELALRIALELGKVEAGTSARVACAWLSQREADRTDERATAVLLEARRSALASEKSARWTFWAAIAAAIGALSAAVPAVISMFHP